MSRKINVRSPFYLFIDDANLNTGTTTSTTTSTTTTSSTTTAAPVAGTTFSCPTFTGGGIAQNGTITDPTPSAGTIVGKSESYQGALITSVAANNGINNFNKTLYFKILVPTNSNLTNSGGYIWCSVQFTQTTTTSSTTQSNQLPTWTCNTGQLSGGSATASGVVTNPNVNGGQIVGFSFTNQGTVSQNLISNPSSTSNVTRALWWKILPNGSYNNQGQAVWCQHSIVQAYTTTSSTTSQVYTEFYLSAGRNSLSDFCNTGSSVQNIVSVTGANRTYSTALNQYVYTINNGNATIFNGSNKWFLVYNSPMNYAGTGSFNYWEVTPQGYIVSSGIYSSCTTTSGGGGGEIGNEY